MRKPRGSTTFTVVGDGTIRIPLTKGLEATIDADSLPEVWGRAWCAYPTRQGFYAQGSQTEDSKKREFMHRVIMDAKPGEQVDHKNHDGLDNRRCNLRIATGSQNGANQRKTRGSSRYKGVSRQVRASKWQASIRLDSRSKHLGLFESEEDAAIAYDEAALAQWGDFAHLNFPGLVGIHG